MPVAPSDDDGPACQSCRVHCAAPLLPCSVSVADLARRGNSFSADSPGEPPRLRRIVSPTPNADQGVGHTPDESDRGSANDAERGPEDAWVADLPLDAPWRLWGPYQSGRQWGTVREDYFANGDAWSYLPFDQAHSRAYRWG